MPTVPSYDNFQVTPNTLPQARMAMPKAVETPDVAGKQAQQLGGALQQAGQGLGQIALDMAQEANQARVTESLNALKEEQIRLEHDKNDGFLRIQGRNALERPGGKALADEYHERLKQRADAIVAGLGNDAQRAAFSAHAGGIMALFKGKAMEHEAKQGRAYQESVYKGVVDTASREIALNAGDEKVLAASFERIRMAVEEMGRLTGAAHEQVQAQTRKETSNAMRGAVGQMLSGNPHQARAFLDKHQNKMEYGDVLTLRNEIENVAVRYDGMQAGEAIFRSAGPMGVDFESIFQHVLKVEGGYVANDAGKGETNLGINKTANPDLDIKGMTVSKAREVYRQRYWNAIGGDQLPPQVRAIAFDAAVNHGPSFANKIVAEAGGDPARLLALRRAEYARLVAHNPAKYGKFSKAWEGRLRSLEEGLVGRRSTSDMLAQSDQIADPKRRAIAQQVIKEAVQRNKDAAEEQYGAVLQQAQNAAFAKVGGWRDIDPRTWAQLSREDQARMIEGPKKSSDPDTLLKLQMLPEEWKAGRIEQYRHLLAETDYRSFYDKGNGPKSQEKIIAASIDVQQFQDVLTQAGLYGMMTSKKETDKQTLIDLRAKFEREIDAEQQRLKRGLTMDEKNTLLRQLVKPVKVQAVRTGSIFGLFDGPTSPMDVRVFQAPYKQGILVPEQDRKAIADDMQKRGITPTEDNILQAYLHKK